MKSIMLTWVSDPFVGVRMPIIRDDDGNRFSIAEAKRWWKRHGDESDCNLAFARLVENNFDLDAVERFYNIG